MKTPLTDKQAKVFHSHIAKWAHCFNLNDWRINFNPKPSKGSLAEVRYDIAGKLVEYRIGGDWGDSDMQLEEVACHEMIHVLLASYQAAIEAKADESLIMSEEHRIVHILTRLLCPTK